MASKWFLIPFFSRSSKLCFIPSSCFAPTAKLFLLQSIPGFYYLLLQELSILMTHWNYRAGTGTGKESGQEQERNWDRDNSRGDFIIPRERNNSPLKILSFLFPLKILSFQGEGTIPLEVLLFQGKLLGHGKFSSGENYTEMMNLFSSAKRRCAHKNFG